MKRLIAIVFVLPSLLLAQHTINGVFSPAKDYKVVLLYKATPTMSKYIKNAEIKNDGSFQFQLDSTLTKGIYKIVYAIPQEDYNFDVIYNGKEDIELDFNPERGVVFLKSFENKLLSSYSKSMSKVTQSIRNFYSKESPDTTALKTIFKIQRETQNSFENAAKGTIVLEFIKANKPYIPKTFVTAEVYLEGLKTHYFDSIDFNNKTLQSSNLLEEKMLNYVFGVTSKTKDEITNYKDNIDAFCMVMKSTSPEVKRILLVDLWQQMADLGKEEVANYISETYLMDIAVSLNDQKLLHKLILYKDLSMGNEAPDFSFQIVENGKTITRKLSELKGYKNYIIVFWSTTCTHCLDEIPQLYAYYKTLASGSTQIIAIALEEEESQWKALKLNYPEFIHVYGKGKWDNDIVGRYAVVSTPTYYILDTNKHIISKPEDVDALKEWFGKK
ncbi:TlpA family protein disulfide reductase [Aestuariivivens sediminis]|uniref:TlpA family protein disulfide reductase n=1 Tax=Aestuariivivens sediminis TaxID=2913557 RepID=UPI001F59C503|nr:TlpA disulfide reductase family protein [Aestuariivivens sediminis]